MPGFRGASHLPKNTKRHIFARSRVFKIVPSNHPWAMASKGFCTLNVHNKCSKLPSENLAMPWFPPSRLFPGTKPPQIVANNQQLYFLPGPFSKHIQHSRQCGWNNWQYGAKRLVIFCCRQKWWFIAGALFHASNASHICSTQGRHGKLDKESWVRNKYFHLIPMQISHFKLPNN